MIIAAASFALWQITAARGGATTPVGSFIASIATGIEAGTSYVTNGIRGFGTSMVNLPNLSRENATLQARNAALESRNALLLSEMARYREHLALQPLLERDPHAIEASVIGFPPENESRTVTINVGSRNGVHKDDGVATARGIVGRIVAVTEFSSTVLLATDYTSRIPAVIRRGRWWGIARGNLTSIRVEFISQDAHLKLGDTVVTGEGRSFHAGLVIGRIIKIERSDELLYQSAIVKPTVDPGALNRVVVLAR